MFRSDLLQGQRILVTGGATGLGFAMASELREYGAGLVLLGRRQEKLDEAAAQLGGEVQTVSCDIRDAEAVEKALDEIWARGPLDALINNAAGNFAAPSESLSHRAVDAVLNTVLHGTTYMTLGCGRRWLEEGRKASVLSIVTTYARLGACHRRNAIRLRLAQEGSRGAFVAWPADVRSFGPLGPWKPLVRNG